MRRSYCLAIVAAILMGLSIATLAQQPTKPEAKPVPAVLKYKMKSLTGEEVDLSKYQGKVIMMVNTASNCGFTPQYEQLEAIYKKYSAKGFVVLGFPANNFLAQEPGTDIQIAAFCKENYGVTFPMFSKISVLEPEKSPLYKYLTEKEQSTTKESGEVKWNFEKFLIGRDGHIAGRYRSTVKPDAANVIAQIEAELAKPEVK